MKRRRAARLQFKYAKEVALEERVAAAAFLQQNNDDGDEAQGFLYILLLVIPSNGKQRSIHTRDFVPTFHHLVKEYLFIHEQLRGLKIRAKFWTFGSYGLSRQQQQQQQQQRQQRKAANFEALM